ncbi:hypothetical protein ILYODFUR_013799 [Ilyodon furcidens]|uniref:Uncharacterized protein n=1 Tax=Ilyodon furcidens TaxID=33524 RepID=A0ABV0TIE4_9TELE
MLCVKGVLHTYSPQPRKLRDLLRHSGSWSTGLKNPTEQLWRLVHWMQKPTKKLIQWMQELMKKLWRVAMDLWNHLRYTGLEFEIFSFLFSNFKTLSAALLVEGAGEFWALEC